MADSNQTIEVMANALVKHQGDTITVDDRGTLLIHFGNEIVCAYPQGQWFRAYKGQPANEGLG